METEEEKAVDQTVISSQTYKDAGNVFFKNGEYEQAIEQYSRAIVILPFIVIRSELTEEGENGIQKLKNEGEREADSCYKLQYVIFSTDRRSRVNISDRSLILKPQPWN